MSNYRVSGISVGYTRYPWLFAGGPNFNCRVYNVDATGNTALPTSTALLISLPLCSSEVLMPKPASYAWTGLVGYVIVADVVLVTFERKGSEGFGTMSSAFQDSLAHPVSGGR